MIFLLSSERSGSNMIRTIIGRHSEVSAPPPPHLLRILMPMLPAYGDLNEDNNLRQLVTDALAVLDSQLGRWQSNPDVDAVLSQMKERTFPELIRCLYDLEAEVAGKNISFIKDNGSILVPVHLQAMFPEGRLVYLVRDPRDYVLSWLRSPTHVGGIRHAVTIWKNEQEPLLNAMGAGLDRNRLLITRYEDLVSNATAEVTRICKFAGIRFEATMLEGHGSKSETEEARSVKNWENVARKVNAGNHGKYRRELPARHVRRIERQLAWHMRLLDYPLTASQPQGNSLADFTGKTYRALRSSLSLLVGGRERRAELAKRLRRLRVIKRIQDQRYRQASPITDKDSVNE